ncbi:MAG: hypothetical protein IJS68_02910 [Clostridia bacterium]|nr:hypothetical protein [Clostridia bacterium]
MMPKIESLSEDSLYNLNIHDLRKLGSQVGVKSPSSLNKADLVSSILSIVLGVSSPYKQKDKRGRPSKATLSDLEFEEYSSLLGDVGQMNVASPEFMNYAWDSTPKNQIKTGVVVAKNGVFKACKYPFVESAGDVVIPQDVVNDYGLREFDVVSFSMDKIDGKNEIKEILTVNGWQITEEEKKFNRLEKGRGSALQIKIEANGQNLEVCEGTKALVFAPVSIKKDDIATEICRKMEGVSVVKLSIDKEAIENVNKNGVNEFGSLVIDNIMVASQAIKNALGEAKALASEGKKVAIVIDNLVSFGKNFSDCYGANADTYVKRFLFTAGCFKNGASITIIALCPTEKTKAKYADYFDANIKLI